MAELTAKQEMFIREYLIDLNGAQAAIRAGYSANSARQIADENLSKPYIKEAIEKAKSERQEELGLNAEWVLKRLKLIADRCIQAEPVLDKKGNPTGVYKFDSAGANKATELIGKHLVLFTENIIANLKTDKDLSEEEINKLIEKKLKKLEEKEE